MIGEQGHLKGRIRAGNVVVSGRVEGSIAAKRLEIVSGGVVEGEVQTVDLVIEPGGRFNGSSELLDESAAETAQSEASRSSSGRQKKRPETESETGLSGDETPSTT